MSEYNRRDAMNNMGISVPAPFADSDEGIAQLQTLAQMLAPQIPIVSYMTLLVTPTRVGAVTALQARGIQVHMLSGDQRGAALAAARELGLPEAQVQAPLLPEQKLDAIARLRERGLVAMVGDGVNDAPALATADLGIAMGAMGSDVAIETADIALMGDDLRTLPHALEHGRRARTIMLQNVALSLALITTLIPLALLGILGLAAVVAAHELAEIVVIANGVRAGRAHPLPPAAGRPTPPLHATTAETAA